MPPTMRKSRYAASSSDARAVGSGFAGEASASMAGMPSPLVAARNSSKPIGYI